MRTQDLELYTNLSMVPNISPTQRQIEQGSTLICAIPGSYQGYVEGGIYSGNYPVIVRVDGMPGNQPDLTGGKDVQDGIIEIPTFHKFNPDGQQMDFPLGSYFLKIEAAITPGEMVPKFWNIAFDIVTKKN